MKATIVGSGNRPEKNRLLESIDSSQEVIAVDGGYDYLKSIGAPIHRLIGDLDSVAEREYLDRDLVIDRYSPEKDVTDMMIALTYCHRKGYDTIDIYGGIGSRMDHTMANILGMVAYVKKGLMLTLFDQNNIIQILNRDVKVSKEGYKYLSLLALTEEGLEVTIKGVKYPLDKAKICFGDSIGVSNEIIDGSADIVLHRGIGLLILSKD